MSSAHRAVAPQQIPGAVSSLMAAVCARVAPTWPLDRFIAVNPLWEQIDRPIADVAVELSALGGVTLLKPRGWYAELARSGALRTEHLVEAKARAGVTGRAAPLQWLLRDDHPTEPRRRESVIDVVDRLHAPPGPSWREVMVSNISQFAASYFDDGQATFPMDRTGGMYASWQRLASTEDGPSILTNWDGLTAELEALPDAPEALVALALETLDVPAQQQARYLSSVLFDVNGWASWCAYERWTARLEGRQHSELEALLAIRVAWELLAFRRFAPRLADEWRLAMGRWDAAHQHAEARRDDWLLQSAAEIAFQEKVVEHLEAGFAARPVEHAGFQAVFCIDVRSEAFRRALEGTGDVETKGFAGFFGMPLQYTPEGGGPPRPQLPGLLAARFNATETSMPDTEVHRRRTARRSAQALASLRTGGLGMFSFVEAVGLGYATRLFRETTRSHPERSTGSHAPSLVTNIDGSEVAPEARVQLADGVLRAMGLTRGFARLVLLVGHESSTRNNAHAAGLDCGACCGQSGRLNARVAAELLNDPRVRAGLAWRGITIPDATRFLGAVHDTTTDEVTVFDDAGVAAFAPALLAKLEDRLCTAARDARRERSRRVAGAPLTDEALARAARDRAHDWSEVRPEWGLANNAAFIVAPRERTSHASLDGRAFLHDYRFEDDPEFKVLELIMTAPMVVTHWINFQYYASTVDPDRLGSGNKVLHNVVGGHLGVFEGNGGDLRIGLPLQSLHDGSRWMHEPLRLSVFIEAPREAIDGVVARHAVVRSLVENGWLHLLQLDRAEASVSVRTARGWRRVSRAEQH